MLWNLLVKKNKIFDFSIGTLKSVLDRSLVAAKMKPFLIFFYLALSPIKKNQERPTSLQLDH